MLTVGILGGMGPMATADLFTKIIRCTPASTDQEHVKIIIYNNPQIPSRIDAITKETESPLPELIRSAKFLEKSGVDIVAMPCNTAHYWYKDIQAAISVKLINMIDNTAKYLRQRVNPDSAESHMLFATAATVQTKLYQDTFRAAGLTLLVPTPKEQTVVSLAIDQVKTGFISDNPHLKELSRIIKQYCDQNITSFIAGCTEIPLLFDQLEGNYRKIDPTLLLAQTVVRLSTGSQP